MKSPIFRQLLILIGLAVATYSAAIDGPVGAIDFYQLYDNPEAHIGLKDRLTTADRIAAHGYPSEHHHVITEDGYIVGIFRIPYSHKLQNQNEKRPIVLIQHGLTSCSDAWILCGPNDGLPYLLADAGYDVWMGNGRGNTYSRNHTTLSTKHPHFWQFSWHEIGLYDIAAMIDYALSTDNGKGQDAIHYVGHSQGTTVFFALMSSRPEYNKKIKTAHMFAPVAIMKNMANKLVRALGPYLGHQTIYAKLFGSQEFLPHNDFLMALLFNLCEPDFMLRPVCESTVQSLYTGGRVNMTAMPDGLATHPSGCSTDQMLHYIQEQQSGYFRQFDYGPKKNLQVYGSEEPPEYPVELITSDVHLWYSDNDAMAAVEDVEALGERLPKKSMHRMADKEWDHGDFALNHEVRVYLNEPVIAIMEEYEKASSAV
ncbi:GL22025 [Drosophila persimilis]|uniref:Lipase n=1 Tax=Drosophila persimilis TaxID=7234 RepID=B4GEJ0_DROPE|nr:lipase 3 [Drosophila persimilis]EDW34025.1 GL22025 [Drosophila persimilis]